MVRRRITGYNSRQRRTATIKPMPAPIGGLNSIDGLAAMPMTDAYDLENWFPKTDGLETRRGYTPWATDAGAAVYSLAVYEAGASPQLLGFADGTMYNATASGVVSIFSVLASGRVSDKVVTTMFANAATQFLYIVSNGDTPATYDGTTYTTRSVTVGGVAKTDFVFVANFKSRLFLIRNKDCGFYYLAVGAVAGAATRFDLGEVATSGGYVVSVQSITRDGGNGPDDYIAFIMSTGEIIVYQGNDPSSATNWGIVGRYRTAKPIGVHCAIKFGGDVIVITEMGLIALLSLFTGSEYRENVDPISNKIGSALKQFVPNADLYGWQACLHGASDMLIFNVPRSGTSYYQFVMNTGTQSWTRFKGMDALCWCVLDRELYFGAADGSIYKADYGYDDNGAPVEASAKQAFGYFDDARRKHFTTARIMFQFSGTPPIITGFNVDYGDDATAFSDLNSITNSGSAWDTAPWDTSGWSVDAQTAKYEMTINKDGYTGSLWFRSSSDRASLKWFATEVEYEITA